MKTNHQWTRIDQKTDGSASTTSGAKMLLQLGALGVTMSWDDGFPGARASRPHQAWHSLGHLPHWVQPGTAPWLSFGLADAVPADRVAACSTARKLSRGQRHRMRAGPPRSQAMPSRRSRGGGARRATSQKAGVRPLGNSRLPASPAPAPPRRGGSFEGETTDPYGLSGAGTCPVKPVCDSNVFVVHPEGLLNHQSVKHSVGEYVKGMAHTNGVESFWALLKRGYYGTCHKMSPAHLHRYVAGFEGRHNDRKLNTLDQMALMVQRADQKQWRYKDLIRWIYP